MNNECESKNLNQSNNSITQNTKPQLRVYEKLEVPNSIVIGDYTYVFKEQFKSDKNMFTYRCQKYNCRVPINITKQNLNKITDHENKDNIDYIIKKEHICLKDNLIKIEKSDNCSSEEELISKAKNLIKLNPLGTLTFHQIKLHENNIYLDDVKVKRLINITRNNLYPKDDDYLNNINYVTITFDEKITNARNIPFCPSYSKYLNPSKNYRFEKYIILTSIFQLLFLSKASDIFIDATFKVAPQNFYQILNIMIYEESKTFTIPIAHVLMPGKSYYSYKKVFQDLKNIIRENNIKLDYNNIIIHCDFEKSLIKCIREEFDEARIYGCFFHYIKALWKKCRNLGLTKKKLLNHSKIIIFSLKIYPFIIKKNKDKYIKEIYDYALSIDKNYKSFVDYFKKKLGGKRIFEF
jgi:hypothetical protein